MPTLDGGKAAFGMDDTIPSTYMGARDKAS